MINSKKPENAEELSVEGATVPFYKYTLDKGTIVEFDTSKCGPPEPMVNAMLALKFIDKDTSVLMINHKKPMGLLGKIEENFDIEDIELSDGSVRLLFKYSEGKSEQADLSDNSCHG
jgi:hypothetical protein